MNINIDFKDACILSIFCILIVFIVLIVISLSINLIRIFIYRHENISNLRSRKKNSQLNNDLNFKSEKIEENDDSMLIAAFVASIDAVDGNNNKTVRIKSIRQIK